MLHRQLVLDAQRVGLSPIERAKAIQRLKDEAGWSGAEVAAKLGLSPANVAKLLTLLILPESVQQHVAGGRLAMSTAYELAKLPDATVRDRLTAEAVSGRLPRDQIARKAKEIAAPPPVPPRPRQKRERVVLALGEGRSIAVTGPGLNVERLAAWVAELLNRIKQASGSAATLADVVRCLAKSGPHGAAREASGNDGKQG